MESQQMMELLLKEIRAGQENRINQEKMGADRKADQAKAEADRKIDKEERKAAQTKADADRVQMQEMMLHANQTKTDAKLEGLSDRIEKTQMALDTRNVPRRDNERAQGRPHKNL
jgi:hypothetical protein